MFELTSTAFEANGYIPAKYTCDGRNISPPLSWQGAPPEAASFALICDDPDAPVGTWVHWVLWNIPAGVSELAEGIPGEQTLADGARHGKNGWGRAGYGGPCPPMGTHRYFFKLYALDTLLELAPGASKKRLLSRIKDHILAEAELIGRYSRG